MAGRLRVSIILPVHGVPYETTRSAACAAERAGFDGVWVPDHLLNEGRPEAGVLECWTVLSAIAEATERVPIGPLVLATPLRHPVRLAKAAASLDAIAPGRVRLGLGAGGFTYERACEQFGVPVLSPRERVDHVEESIRALRALLTDDPARFEGRYVQAHEIRIHPRPRAPIPIWGAARRPRMLGVVARLADGWNCPLPWEVKAGLATLERLGRARETLTVSAFAIGVVGESEAAARRDLERAGPAAQLFGDVETHHVFGAPERVAARLRALAAQGVQHVTLDIRGGSIPDSIHLIARDVLPLLR
ncbi:MAG: LLM class flavin-dependent oxidoreductase [Myxococcales bacterium]|nr:LLM class flavin-dependent oxidoreductase [Myxococcales bacterium]